MDLVPLDLAPLPFRFEVITTGNLPWTANRAILSDSESITRRRCWDVQPLLERDWRASVERSRWPGMKLNAGSIEQCLRKLEEYI